MSTEIIISEGGRLTLVVEEPKTDIVLSELPGLRGPAGESGADGADGTPGASAYQIAVANGFVGTEAEWLESLAAPAGAGGSGLILLEYGAAVPAETPVGTVVYEKAPPSTQVSFTSGAPAGYAFYGGYGTPSYGPNGVTIELAVGGGIRRATDPLSDTIWQAEVHSAGTANQMYGPMIVDGSGNGFAAILYTGSPAGLLLASVSGWQYGGGFNNVTAGTTFPKFLRVRKSGTEYFAGVSSDGSTWTEAASLTSSIVPAWLGVGNIYGGNQTPTLKSTKFATASTQGGLRGWWDGSVIQKF